MAVINPPMWMQSGSYPARNDRLALTALLSYPGFAADEATPLRIRQGVKPSFQNYQLKVRSAPTPNMTVIVSAGFAFIDQHDTGGQGTYICVNDGDVTLTVQPAGSAGQYRKDTVVASVYDAEYAGSSSEWQLEVIQGPYAASAGTTVRGTLPPNAQVLADITVNPSQSSVSSGNIFDARNYSVAAGGVLPVASNIAPNRPHPGQVMYLTDTDAFKYGKQDGTVGTLREDTGWIGMTLPSGFSVFSSSAYPVQIRKINGQCFLRGRMTRGTTIPNGTTFASWIPSGFRPLQSTSSYQDVYAVTGAGPDNVPGMVRCEVVGNGDFRIAGLGLASWLGFPTCSWWAD
ncbi:minor tail protein [Streptomyces phage OnionKnight]|nr:minor tail protein [Streptomyces phage OnionKnight]